MSNIDITAPYCTVCGGSGKLTDGDCWLCTSPPEAALTPEPCLCGGNCACGTLDGG